MRILLVYPKIPPTFWGFQYVLRHNFYTGAKTAYPPLGLLTVAAMLPVEWEKKLADENTEKLTDDSIKWADYVFVSAMIVQQGSAKEVIKRCRQLNKKIVAGGPLFSGSKDIFAEVDHLITGEAEVTLPAFLKDLKNNKAERIYSSDKKADLIDTPAPMWDLVNIHKYVTMPVQFSRGCPYDCEFCDITTTLGRTPRLKTPEQIIIELDHLRKLGWRSGVFFVDDNFIGNKIKVKKVLNTVIEWQKKHGYPFSFFTQASIDLAEDKQLMGLMSEANFEKVFIGIETLNIESLKECRKYQNLKFDLRKRVSTIEKNGMMVFGGFIVGFDNDKPGVFDEIKKFVQETGIVLAMTGILMALPKTKLWERLKKEGRLLTLASGNNTDIKMNFVPKMNPGTLINGYKKLLDELYLSADNYYKRIGNFIKIYEPTAKKTVNLRELKAFMKSVWIIGFRSKEKWLYWKLLIKTALTKPKALPIAIEMSIYYLHFWVMSDMVINGKE
ncbi:MAG: B12-binding domain-containing radical SAM protein [bacterium]|nr:B12-binding domain-containing radical SAM protein [bacterium]